MSSMAPEYRGEVFGKQIYTMHILLYTHTHTQTSNLLVVFDKEYFETKSLTAVP